jgi:multidrug efflux pump subunit AcrB
MAEQVTQEQSLGIAGQMAKAFIHSPLSPLLFIAMFFMGIMGLILTPRQEDPQISVPMVDIFVQYPGASSQQVASLAIEPLQRIMSEIPGVKHVYSAAERSQGMVTVQFEVGEELEKSVFKVHDKLQSNLDMMPPGVHPPLVKPKGVDDVPIVNLTLWSHDVDDAALRTLALDIIHNVNQINEVGKSFVVGGREEQVRIEVLPERLSGYSMSIGQIAQAVQSANSEQRAGYTETGGEFFTVYTGSFLRTAQDVERLVVGSHQGQAIHIRDVARVSIVPSETHKMVNYFSGQAYGYEQVVQYGNFIQELWRKVTHKHYYDQEAVPLGKIDGASAVTIAVSKKIGTNGVTVAKDVIKRVKSLQGSMIPDNVKVEITRNYGKTAKDKVNDLIIKLFIATGAVTLLVLYFFRHIGYQPAFVVTVVIPVVILITVFSAWVMGFTIDRVSLFALIFSIGILVDDAIVVVENIYRRWLMSESIDTETAIDAVREVGNPTILATFTVVAALLPMGFVSGMMGPYMAPIPVLGSVAMVFSLVAAFIFVPWIIMRIKPRMETLIKAEKIEHEDNERLERFYRKLIPTLANNRLAGWGFLTALVFSFFLAISMFYTTGVEVKMLPLDNKPEYSIYVDMPEGTALPETANLVYEIVERLRNIKEVNALQTYVGTSRPFDFNGMVRHYYLRDRPWQADIQVQLVDKEFRKRSSHELATEARVIIQQLLQENSSPARVTVVEMPPGPPVLQSVVAEVYGPTHEIRRQVAQDLTTFFEQAAIVSDVDNYMISEHHIWKFEVDGEKAVRRGISVDTINQNLMMALGGFKLGDIKRGYGLEPTYIIIQVPLDMRAQLTSLYDLPIPNNQGQTIPLVELGRFVQAVQDPIIYQKDLRPVEYVVGDSVGLDLGDNRYRLSAPIYGILEVENLLKDYTTPDGVNLSESDCFTVLGFIPLCQRFLGAPTTAGSGFEWSGEWTVTYETFRDMGIAFAVALVLIYILVVWLFGNFIVPLVIMAPIPLTLLGIIPGHMLLGASFTATSMIGWIALAGIIVRNSILLVDYSIYELKRGSNLQDSVILACKTRTRPIMITAWALVGGGMVILYDPIFQGMAISLLFGVMISTILTLVVIPLGCIAIGEKAMLAGSGDLPLPPDGNNGNGVNGGGSGGQHSTEHKTEHSNKNASSSQSVGMLAAVGNVLSMAFYIVRGLLMLLWMGLVALWKKFFGKEEYGHEERVVARAVHDSPNESDEVKKKPLTTEVVTEKPIEPPVAEKPIEPPVAEKPIEPPIAEKPIEPPVAEKPIEPPVAEKPIEPPVAEKPIEPPVAEKPIEPPVAEKPIEPPVAEKPIEPPVAEKPIEPPVAEKPIEPPVAEKPIEPPVAEKPIEPPVAEKPIEPPAKERKTGAKRSLSNKTSARRGIRLKSVPRKPNGNNGNNKN